MIAKEIDRIRQSFHESIGSVQELLDFDHIVLDFAITHIREHSARLKKQKFENPYLSAETTLKALTNIREHDSMRIQYKRIFNQCLVLLVSHFASTVRDLFQSSVDQALKVKTFEKVNKVKIEVTLADLQNDIEKTGSIGEILAIQKDISFQDMQSIARAFQDYFEFEIPKDSDVNNIILAQACRHAIVHSGSRVDEKLVKQARFAIPRSIKETLERDSEILFAQDEIEIIADSMKKYLETVFKGLHLAFDGA